MKCRHCNADIAEVAVDSLGQIESVWINGRGSARCGIRVLGRLQLHEPLDLPTDLTDRITVERWLDA